jgi:predicted transcriptional regulator
MEERVMHLMRRGALTCLEDCTVRQVAQIMTVNRIRYCVILNKDHEVEGIISTRSILKAFGQDLDKSKAKDILLPYTITITPRSSLKEALDMMTDKKIEYLVVVSDRPGSKAVLGILSAADIVIKMSNE